MAVNLSPIGNGFQFFTTTGIPLAGGKIYTYQAGSSTPLATYTDNTGATANANPIVLGTDGRPTSEVWLTYGFNYKFILKTADDTTIQTYDNLYGIIGTAPASGATIPAGLISMWSGSIGSIPSGWYLCDGSNGTPNLTDRFIIGAGSTYAVNGTGGVSSVTLTTGNMPAHTHTITDPGHNHTYSRANATSPQTGSTTQCYVSSVTDNTGTSTTGITINTAGSGTSFSILNPYYALAFIQKS